MSRVPLGELIATAPVERARDRDFPILSMTMRDGLVDQAVKFKKRVASQDIADYRVVHRDQLVVGFPIDEAVLSFQRKYDAGVVSPAYGIWDVINDSSVDRKYLEGFLRSPHAIAYYKGKLRGSTARRRSLPREIFLAMEVPLPPIEEQRRIAAVLDAADDLRTKRRQALAKLDTLTQAIFIDMFGDPLRGAATKPLGNWAEFVGGGTPSKAKPEYFEGENCWATSKDMKPTFLHDTQDHVTDEAIGMSATKLVPAGSVLVVVKSKVLAHRLPVAIARVPLCFGQDLKAVPPTDGYPSEFIAGALRAVESWLLAQARGINTEGLTLAELRRVPVPDSEEAQRHAFAGAAQQVEIVQTRTRAELAELDTLFASLQQRAFAGEL